LTHRSQSGKFGGEIISRTPAEILATHTMTAMYLNGEMKIEIPEKREGNGKFMKLTGATGNNLKRIHRVAFG
jgi:excinuclease ABC subunit A